MPWGEWRQYTRGRARGGADGGVAAVRLGCACKVRGAVRRGLSGGSTPVGEHEAVPMVAWRRYVWGVPAR